MRRMKIDPTWDAARCRLFELITERGVRLAPLSRAIGRNAAYVQQYLYRGSPAYLHEDDRLKLANYFKVSPEEFRPSRGTTMQESPVSDSHILDAAIIATLIALTESGRSLDEFAPEEIARAILRTYNGLTGRRTAD
jgi:hypothetical protein